MKQPAQTVKYMDVLLTYRGLISYRAAVFRPSLLTSAVADNLTRSWVTSAGSVLNLVEQKPIVKKADLVYLASLPARQVPDTTGDILTLPPLRFFLTINNKTDSSKVWVINLKTAYKAGHWQSLEKRQPIEDKTVAMM